MRFDKLTTKFQQALADAQSVAARQDHPYLEPAHVLAALLADSESGAASLLAQHPTKSKAGVLKLRLRDAPPGSAAPKFAKLPQACPQCVQPHRS